MNIKINDKEVTFDAAITLQEALDAHGIKPQGIATAVNGTVVPSTERESLYLKDGDNVVIIKAFYGG